MRIFERVAVTEAGRPTAVRTLSEQSEVGLNEALKAGRTVEADDIAALTKMLSGLTAPDVVQVQHRPARRLGATPGGFRAPSRRRTAEHGTAERPFSIPIGL
ncbi:hypothetical protein [Streptomyces sp. GQFP]|uniref:hypothetical protein n=1 Tax=Streptomyces sp. GQFP TaxID=2907545 RepID=UPI001F25D671|nr:hypothetical protein [Streptomyces sp. GQFP]UIX34205.1 hypothetical protein LUX31_31715 [Streptomyces sp. GQFP]